MADEYDFDFDRQDLTPQQQTVRYGGKTYVLREASEGAAIAFRDRSARGLSFQDGKVARVDGIAEVQALLVSECLFKADADGQVLANGQGQPVRGATLQELKGWPSRFVRRLFDWVKAVSQLAEEETEESLARDIAALQGRLARLRGDDPNAPPPSAGSTSDSSE